jgi:hypothetical protein
VRKYLNDNHGREHFLPGETVPDFHINIGITDVISNLKFDRVHKMIIDHFQPSLSWNYENFEKDIFNNFGIDVKKFLLPYAASNIDFHKSVTNQPQVMRWIQLFNGHFDHVQIQDLYDTDHIFWKNIPEYFSHLTVI